MNDYIISKEAAKLKGISLRAMNRKCAGGEYPDAKKTASQWYIPRTADARFAIDAPENLVNSDELADVPSDKRQDALKKLGLIEKFRMFRVPFKGEERIKAEFEFASANNISRSAIYRWLSRYRIQGLLGLVDTRGGGKFLSQIISDEAFELFKSMYLKQQQLSVKTCWQNINFINKDERHNWKIPPLQFMYKFVKNRIPLPVQILHREGLAAYEAKCAPFIQKDPDSINPGQVWVGDHSQCNCWVQHRGRWIRPWLTAWQDMRSRAIVGYYISACPNQTTILQAFRRAAVKYGPPESVKIDNGRDYDSEAFTGTTKARRRILNADNEQMIAGMYAMMNIGVSFAIAYHPQSKGTIERFFDTLDCQFIKTIPTYCGKDTARRPEDFAELLANEKIIQEAYNLETLAEIIDEYIEVYNNTAHNGAGMNNQSPMQVFATRQSRRMLAEGVLDLLMRVWSGELTAGKNGVRFKGMYYGQYNTELLMHQGRKVRLSYDPDDLRQVYIYDSTTLKLITIAEQNQLIQYGSAIDEENLREAMRQKSRALKMVRGYRDSSLTANMDLTTLTIKAMQEAAKEKSEVRRQKAEEKQQEKHKSNKYAPHGRCPACGFTGKDWGFKHHKLCSPCFAIWRKNKAVGITGITNIKPVRTLMDNQVREHQRQQLIKAVKKASGAESLTAVLDMDFSLLKRNESKIDLKLFR